MGGSPDLVPMDYGINGIFKRMIWGTLYWACLYVCFSVYLLFFCIFLSACLSACLSVCLDLSLCLFFICLFIMSVCLQPLPGRYRTGRGTNRQADSLVLQCSITSLLHHFSLLLHYSTTSISHITPQSVECTVTSLLHYPTIPLARNP